jgi:hypothetical protein
MQLQSENREIRSLIATSKSKVRTRGENMGSVAGCSVVQDHSDLRDMHTWPDRTEVSVHHTSTNDRLAVPHQQ